jgi:phosphoglycolate phosphatase
VKGSGSGGARAGPEVVPPRAAGNPPFRDRRSARRCRVIFDLDGTLIDGYEPIRQALAYAMEKFGKPAPGLAEVRRMVGHGLERLIEKALGPDLVAAGVAAFRERYPQVLGGSRLLPGATETLAELERRNHRMALASNKPARFSCEILERLGVRGYFAAVAGPDDKVPPKPSPEMVISLLAVLDAAPGETILVGDMEVDVETARNAGCRVVLIPTGSRTRSELGPTGPDRIIERLTELPDMIERLVPSRGRRDRS